MSEAALLRTIKFRVWMRRLRSAQQYEAKQEQLSTPTHTTILTRTRNVRSGGGGGGKGVGLGTDGSDPHPFGAVDWLRCGNVNCGKWRACLRGMNGAAVMQKMRVCVGNAPGKFYCWMNSWDEAHASCSAPQEGFSINSLAAHEMEPVLLASVTTVAAAATATTSAIDETATVSFPAGKNRKQLSQQQQEQQQVRMETCRRNEGGVENEEDSASDGGGELDASQEPDGDGDGDGDQQSDHDIMSLADNVSFDSAALSTGVSSRGRIVKSRWNSQAVKIRGATSGRK